LTFANSYFVHCVVAILFNKFLLWNETNIVLLLLLICCLLSYGSYILLIMFLAQCKMPLILFYLNQAILILFMLRLAVMKMLRFSTTGTRTHGVDREEQGGLS
jgi:hypothetical protein